MMPTWKKPSSVSQQGRRMSVRGWKPRVSAQRSLPWPLLLHVSLLLLHKVLSAVDLRGSGATIPDACVLIAAGEQQPLVLRPAAERAVRLAAPRVGPAATQRFSRSIRNALAPHRSVRRVMGPDLRLTAFGRPIKAGGESAACYQLQYGPHGSQPFSTKISYSNS